MYILLCGKPPFDGEDDKDIFRRVLTGRYDLSSKVWKSVSKEGKDFLKRMLILDYKKRPYAKDLLDDPWFKNAPSQAIDRELMAEAMGNLRNFSSNVKIQ
jgi:calcium-dependent protein kinase